MKRLLDISAALLGLLVTSPILLMSALAIKLTSRGPVLFRQERVGQNFRPFRINKFRSMVVDAPNQGRAITAGADPRITGIGHFLRKTKLDELPQLWNVLVGEMSLVGPRPEVAKYVELFHQDYEEILLVRPGITDPASIEFRNESELLGQAADPEVEYVRNILPRKITLSRTYIRERSFLGDLGIILRTFLKIVR
jgi:lipopolysaccharide/colanic/teichoic acid biosynthesis glycosyltransferase